MEREPLSAASSEIVAWERVYLLCNQTNQRDQVATKQSSERDVRSSDEVTCDVSLPVVMIDSYRHVCGCLLVQSSRDEARPHSDEGHRAGSRDARQSALKTHGCTAATCVLRPAREWRVASGVVQVIVGRRGPLSN